MDVLNFRLTEISLELLGNRFFDIFGRKCDTLGSLYRSKSGPATDKFAAESDLVASLKIEDIFNSTDEPTDEAHGGNHVRNFNYRNEQISGESSDESDDPECSDNQEQNQSEEIRIARMMTDVEQGKQKTALHSNTFTDNILLFTISEYRRLLIASDSSKMKYFITNKHKIETDYEDEYEICNQYHQQENELLLGQSDALIKLIKYIKCDSRNGPKMGEIAATILTVKDRLLETPQSSKR